MATSVRYIAPGIVFLLTLASGFWLSLAGKPLNGVIFNIHKLIALVAVVFTGILVARSLKGMETQALLIGLLILAALCIVALFATGALMSIGKVDYTLLRTLHNIAPAVLVLTMGAVVYLLAGRMG